MTEVEWDWLGFGEGLRSSPVGGHIYVSVISSIF